VNFFVRIRSIYINQKLLLKLWVQGVEFYFYDQIYNPSLVRRQWRRFALYFTVLSVLSRIHCGSGRFCFIFFARVRLVRKDFWDGWLEFKQRVTLIRLVEVSPSIQKNMKYRKYRHRLIRYIRKWQKKWIHRTGQFEQ